MKETDMKNQKKLYNWQNCKCIAFAISMICCAGNSVWAEELPDDSLQVKKVVHELFNTRDARLTTSSISAISGSAISDNSVSTLGNILYGKVPGLFVQQTSGEPGNDAPTFLIRGKHTFSGTNAPLVLVDGFPRDMNTLTVDEVESISVLKDAAATALYGMDGANGIILVTTKRGQAGQTRVKFNAEFGLSQPTDLPSFHNSYDYVRFYRMAEENDGRTTFTYSDADIAAYRDQVDNMLYPDVDWIDEAIRKATPMQKYSVNISGGNKTAKFFVNLGYSNNKGLYKEIGNKTYNANNDFDRINFRSNVDINLLQHLSVSVDLAGRLENINSPYNSSSAIWQNLYTFHPNATPIFAAPGVWGGTNTYRNNPLAYINDRGYRSTHERLLQANIRFNYDLSSWVKGLSVGVSAAFDSFYAVDKGYSKEYAVQEIVSYDEATGDYIRSEFYGRNTPLTEFGPSNEKEQRYTAYEAYLNYNRTFGKHGLKVKLLGRLDNQSSYMSSSALSSSPDKRAFLSGLLSYDYAHRYLVDLGVSYGGGENFMRGKRFGWYPSLSGAWIISSEKFLEGADFIDFLKLRASIGLVGNQNVGGTLFGYRNLYTNAPGSWGAGTNNGGYGSGYKEAALGNPDLTWEKALKTDVGLDMTLWKGLDLMFNYFYEYRTDILCSGSSMLPSFYGATFGYINYGRVGAQGVEMAASYQKQYKDGGFQIGLNATHQKNKVLRMRESLKNYDYLYNQGLPIGQRFGLLWEGYYTADDVANRDITQSYGTVIPGSLKYVDVNGDKVVNSDDRVPIGKYSDIADWELGLNLGANYKGFYLNANFQARIGRDVNLRESAPYVASPLYHDRNVASYIKQPWTEEIANDPNLAGTIDFPSLSIENNNNNFQYSTYFLRNGNFLRLRSLEIGYHFPKNWIKKARLQAANIYLRGMNLFTLDYLEGFDPEVLEGYPVMRSYNIGINLTF